MIQRRHQPKMNWKRQLQFGRKEPRIIHFQRADMPARLVPKERKYQPNVSKLLRIEGPDFVVGSIWKRSHGQWRCVEAAPLIEWFTRVRHPEVIHDWILARKLSFEWINDEKKTYGDATVNPASELLLPADTRSNSPIVDEGSLKDTTTDERRKSPSLVPAQTGLANPCCLIESDLTDTPQTLPQPV